MDNYNVQIHEKVDELLRRTPHRSESLNNTHTYSPIVSVPRRHTDPVRHVTQRTVNPPLSIIPVRTVTSDSENQAEEYDKLSKQLREQGLYGESIKLARKAVAIRRLTYNNDMSSTNAGALARSLSYLFQSHRHSEGTAPSNDAYMLGILNETVELYRTLFAHDKEYRNDLASMLHNLSLIQWRNPDLWRDSAEAAEEAASHFKQLRKANVKHGVQLFDSYIHLSFVLSHLKQHSRALVITEMAVAIAIDLDKPGMRSVAFGRKSFCLRHLGREREADEWANKQLTGVFP